MHKIKEMNAVELVAYAFAEFGTGRFTVQELATAVCAVLATRFTVGHIATIGELLYIAAQEGLVASMPGVRGGAGFGVTDSGLAAASNVELPIEKFQRRHTATHERDSAAQKNAAPMLKALLDATPRGSQEWDFVNSVAKHWVTKDWLSHSQMARLGEIGQRLDQEIDEASYVGKARDEWVQPHKMAMKARQQKDREERAAEDRARQLAHKEAARKQSEDKAENQRIKRLLLELNATGALNGLEWLVMTVFPTLSISAQAKAAAFGGAGANGMRACIAALAFDAPPNRVWKNQGSIRQPDAASDSWQTLIAHPAYLLKPASPLVPLKGEGALPQGE